MPAARAARSTQGVSASARMNTCCRFSVQPSLRARTGTGVKAGTCGAVAAGGEASATSLVEHKKNKDARPLLWNRCPAALALGAPATPGGPARLLRAARALREL